MVDFQNFSNQLLPIPYPIAVTFQMGTESRNSQNLPLGLANQFKRNASNMTGIGMPVKI